MTPKTNRTKIREAIAKSFGVLDTDERVTKAADNVITAFPSLRDRTFNALWDIQHGNPVSEESKLNHELDKQYLEICAAIESNFSVRMGFNLKSTPGGEKFIKFAAERWYKDQHYDKFISYWLENGGPRQFWSINRFMEQWDGAFITTEQPARPEYQPVAIQEKVITPNPFKKPDTLRG